MKKLVIPKSIIFFEDKKNKINLEKEMKKVPFLKDKKKKK
jgi:hypothetical protein